MQWLFGLVLEIVEYISNSLLNVFSMDMAYFERSVPVAKDIFLIVLAVGWAMLLGNLVFQAMRGMAAGMGFDGEDPKILFMRTCIFSFLLLVSRQICNIGLGMTGLVINMLQVPSSVQIPMPEETTFSIGASWLLVIIIGFIVMWQVVRLFFEVGERYVVTAVLTILSPLAFAMGGSKSTEDIFKGWVRMFGSMCLMMVFNVIFLKMLISVLAAMPDGTGVLPWMILVMGIARVARKIDGIIARIGLNPAITGDGLGRAGIPGMLALTVARSLGGTVAKTMGKNGGGRSAAAGSAGQKPPGPPGGGAGRTSSAGFGRQGRGTSAHGAAAAATGFAAGSQQGAATGTASSHTTASSATQSATSAQASATESKSTQTSATANATQSGQSTTHTTAGKSAGQPQDSAPGQAGSQESGTRRSAVTRTPDGPQQSRFHIHTPPMGAGMGTAATPGTAGTTQQSASQARRAQGTAASPRPTTAPTMGQAPAPGTAGKPDAATAKPGDTRFTTVPPSARQEGRGAATPAPGSSTTRQSSVSTQRTQAERSHTVTREAMGTAQTDRPPPASGTAGKEPSVPAPTRQTQGGQVPFGTGRNSTPAADTRPVSGGQSASRPVSPHHSASATDSRPARQERGPSPVITPPPKAQSPTAQQESRPSTTTAPPPQAQRAVSGTTVRQESRPSTTTATPPSAPRPPSGTAGSAPAQDRTVKRTQSPMSTTPQQQKPPAPNMQRKPPVPGGKASSTQPKPPSRRKKGDADRGK